MHENHPAQQPGSRPRAPQRGRRRDIDPVLGRFAGADQEPVLVGGCTVGQCADPRRDDTQLCVVEGPTDVYAVEQTGYRGRYFVLKGHLSPLDGLGPEAIGIPQLMARIEEQGTFTEVILATNPTVEGEATAHYIAQLLSNKGLITSRIAHGVPLGGELELVDGGTLAHSFAGRKPIAL